MESIFSKIIKNEIPCYKIAETDNCFAFLDVNPNALGHTLCIPKVEEDYIFELESKLYSELLNFYKAIAIAIKKAIPCERVAMSVIGLEVPHVHVHLIPINTMQDLDFSNNLNLEKDSFEEVCNKIKSNLD